MELVLCCNDTRELPSRDSIIQGIILSPRDCIAKRQFVAESTLACFFRLLVEAKPLCFRALLRLEAAKRARTLARLGILREGESVNIQREGASSQT